MVLIKYFVDCSALSPDEFSEIFNWFELHQWSSGISDLKPRTFISFWPSNLPSPYDMREFPSGFVLRKI